MAQIRLATDAELAKVGDLTVASYDADGHLTGPDDVYDQEYSDVLADAHSRSADSMVFVAIDHHELLGTVTWCPPPSTMSELAREQFQGEFRMLAVSPNARTRGIGRQLVEHCVERARKTGLTEIWLSSLPSMSAAHRLYLRLGFERVRERDWYPEPGTVLWAFRLILDTEVNENRPRAPLATTTKR